MRQTLFLETLTQKLLLTFSARANFTEMSHMETTNPYLNVLYGLRTISILVIIMDHRFGTFTSSALINFNYVEQVSIHYRSTIGYSDYSVRRLH